MAATLGNLSLYLILILTLVGCLFSFAKPKPITLKLTSTALFVLCTFAFCSLIHSFATSDFSVLNVYNNSHSTKPLLFKISGAWGNHEGSMLLWLFAMSFFTVLFSFAKHDNIEIKHNTIGIQLLLIAIFTIYVISTSNPFIRIFPAPQDGRGLNAILQDVGLAMHPPVLYMGYVGFSIAYSNVIGVLIAGKNNSDWAKYLRIWVMLSWTFLTIGISLGSWWAYRELGWGGYWYWDPVENASLMPWLFATALLHSLITTQREKALEQQSILLSLATFIFTMIGTFIVRSGSITSVHSFATDPTRGIFIILIISFLFFFALSTFLLRVKKIRKPRKLRLFSGATLILGNIYLLIAAGLIVAFGTLYPIFLELFTGVVISVGAPYYNKVMSPIAILLVILCIFGSQISWRDTNLKHLIKSNLAPLLLSIMTSGLIIFTFQISNVISIIAILASMTLIVGIIEQNSRNFGRIASRYLGITLAHAGFGLLILSVAVNSAAKSEHEFALAPGEKFDFKEYEITFKSAYFIKGDNYVSKRVDLAIDDTNLQEEITVVSPELRYYPIEKQQTVESSSYHYPLYDLYFVIGDEFDDKIQIKLFYQPFIGLLWLSCFLISIGGIFGIAYIINRRIRLI